MWWGAAVGGGAGELVDELGVTAAVVGELVTLLFGVLQLVIAARTVTAAAVTLVSHPAPGHEWEAAASSAAAMRKGPSGTWVARLARPIPSSARAAMPAARKPPARPANIVSQPRQAR